MPPEALPEDCMSMCQEDYGDDPESLADCQSDCNQPMPTVAPTPTSPTHPELTIKLYDRQIQNLQREITKYQQMIERCKSELGKPCRSGPAGCIFDQSKVDNCVRIYLERIQTAQRLIAVKQLQKQEFMSSTGG